MKRITLLLLLTLYGFVGYSQCDPLFNVSPTICADSDEAVFIVDPSQSVFIELENQTTGIVANIEVAQDVNLYTDAALSTPYTAGDNVAGVYFGNADGNQSYTYDVTYQFPSCASTTSEVTIVTGGFTFPYTCSGQNYSVLDDLDIAGLNSADLTWYEDAAGSTSITDPGTAEIQSNQTYYVDLGFAGCSDLFPVFIEGIEVVLSSPTIICSVPEDNLYIVNPSQTFSMEIQDVNGAVKNVEWSPADNLYTDASLSTEYTSGNTVTEIYFGNAAAHHQYTFDVTYQLSSCATPSTTQITIVTGGFTSYDFCHESVTMLDELDLAGIDSADLTWYEDAAGTIPISDPSTTEIDGQETYYVDLGINGCNGIFSVYIADVEIDVTPSICADPEKGIYFVDPSDDIAIRLKSKDKSDTLSVTWTPEDKLYFYPNQQIEYSTFVPVEEVYFYGENAVDTSHFTAQYSSENCSNEELDITLVTNGFVYNDFCRLAEVSLNEVATSDDVISQYTDTLTWYEDKDGTVTLPGTTNIEGDATYYVDLGLNGCSRLFPVVVLYKTPKPSAVKAQDFCTSATWAALGINKGDDVLSDLIACGTNLTWYSDPEGLVEITNPNTEVLVDGTTYYLSQTSNGCESDLLEVEVNEQECSCSKNPSFQNQDGSPNFDDITVYHNPISDYNGFDACNMDVLLNNQISLGAPESPGSGTVFSSYAALTTPGLDPTLNALGVSFPRTSPYAECSTYSLRLNRNIPSQSQNSGIVTIRKEFIAGEIFAFDFTNIMENPTHHISSNDQPWFRVTVFDETGNIIETRCISALPDDCILNRIPNNPYDILYSDWSSLKINTIEAQGTPITVEITASTCAPDFHFAYVYVDNLYVGDDDGRYDNSAFGYLALDPIDTASNPEYEVCSVVKPPEQEECNPALAVNNPVFPFDICGTFIYPDSRGNASFVSVDLDIIQNGVSVGSPSGNISTTPGTNDFCFELLRSDLPATLYGNFTVESEIVFDVTCSNPSGDYDYTVSSNINGFKVCPVANCASDQQQCDDSVFDLTLDEANIASKYDSEPVSTNVTYYLDEDDANDATNAIPNPTNFDAGFSNSGDPAKTIYARLDFDWGALGVTQPEDCYDIITFTVIAYENPTLPSSISAYAECDNGMGEAEFDITTKAPEVLAIASGNPTIDYFTSYNAADNNIATDEIATPTSYVSSGETVYVRVTNGDCYSVGQFDLVLPQFPSYTMPNQPVIECEDSTTGDGTFNLTTLTSSIIGSSNLDVNYFGTEVQAEAGNSSDYLPNPYITNNPSETIWLRLFDPNTNCVRIEPLDIQVNSAPDAIDSSFGTCENSIASDIGSFVLSDFDADISNGASGMTVTYYSSLTDAQNATGTPLPTNYTTDNTTIYARVEDAGGCFSTAEITLTITKKPDIPTAGSLAPLEKCDDNKTGVASFDLEDRLSDILTNVSTPRDYTVNYFDSTGTAITGNDVNNYNSNSSTISVEVEGANGCTSETTFDLVVTPLPTFNAPQDLEECDLGAQDGFTEFVLTDATAQITNGHSNIVVSYYETQNGAELADSSVENPLPNNYTNQDQDTQTVYVRVEDTNTGCFDVASLKLEVIGAPTANEPDPLEVCDDNNDGMVDFPLSQLDSEITANDPDLSVTYYATQNGADEGDPSVEPALPQPFPSGSTTVFARIESSTISCYNTVEVDLVLLPSPDLPNNIDPLEECDENGTGMMSFDLEDRRAAILANVSNPNDYTVRYFDSAGTQITGGDINNYESASTTITVEVEANNGCTSETSFDLIVNPLPPYNTPETRIICDTGVSDGIAEFDLSLATSQITGNNPNIEALYYELQTDAEAGASNSLPLNYTNSNSPDAQTLYVRLRDKTTDCYRVVSLGLQVDEAPDAFEPTLYVYCDDDNDGEGTFYLPDLDNEITGGASGVTVSYHRTLADANNNGVNPLPDNFNNNIDYNQTIFARVESPGVACYNVVEVDLEVRDSPQPVAAQNLDSLEACDDNQTGDAVFDLTQIRPDILANESNPADFTLTYYASQADFNADNPISLPTAYPSNGMSQTIYVLVEGSNGCQDDTSFELIVNPLPTVTPPSPLELCDVTNPGDEKEEFDLTDATLEITGGDTSLDVTYYESQNAANSGIGDLTSPYENTVNNQTIYVRVEDTDTGCVVSEGFTLTLVVNPIPSPEIPNDPIEVCDVDNDGVAEFELSDLTNDIVNNEPNVVVTYHTTQESANSGITSIDTSEPFGVSSVNSQVIYVRATNSVTNCYTTGEIELISVPSPEIANLEDLYECDDDDDGFAVFDLTENTPNILGGQDPSEVNISYHLTQDDAISGDNAIIVPTMYTNIVNEQTIYVRLENDATKCIDVFDATSDNTFKLFVEPLPVIMEPTPLQLCDDDYNNDPLSQTVFNLTSKEGEITGQALPPNTYEFAYYANEQDYLNGNSIEDPANYENENNPQSIYVEVINTDTQEMCADVITMTIEVLPLPSPSITDPDELRIEECDDDNDGITATPFDLTEAGNKISGSENVELSYYKTENAAENGDTSSDEYISDETAYVNEPSYNTVNDDGLVVQEIYVRVDSGVNGNFCYVIVPIEITVVRAPVLTLTDPDEFGYTLCEDGNTGQATLLVEDIAENLYDNTVTDPNTSTLIPLLDEAENDDLNLGNYTITYYEDPNDAETGTDPISSGDLASDGDIIYIRVEYDDTGCYNTNAIGAVRITVEPRPDIQEIDITEVVCSDEQGGSTATVDLTTYNEQINPGSPADTEVVYYANMDDYMTGNNIDSGELTTYTTMENPQTIVAEVIDTNTLCESAVFATVTVEVDDRPVVDISNFSGIICEDSNPSTPTEGGNYDPILIDTGLTDNIYSFVWAMDGSIIAGETEPTLSVTEAGTYTVEVTNDITGCSSTSSATFTQSTPPEFTVAPLTLAFDENHAVLITATGGSGDYEFSVDNGPWISVGADGTLTIDNLSAGNHYVYGRDKNGCGVTVNTISFIDYPKFFTPNEDGYNDRWNIIGLGEENAGANIYIFDRYGKLLKQLSPSGEGWNGTYNGKILPSGDYWFRIEYLQLQPDGELRPAEFKANFTLKR